MRGNDGFGFTICSDCPVRVQSVEPEGPAHQAGLQQGDCVLQMNGVSVESWQCVDLAHAIRGLHQQEPHFQQQQQQQAPMEWAGGGRSFQTATLPPPSSSTSLVISPAPVLPGCYNNYQNCTMMQSHLPCSGYGSFAPLAPKTLIFPVFVQPLDLCSGDRTLLMAEEMVLHQVSLQPTKVMVLIYTDLLLLTREDEAGRCNVLHSPLYLHNIRLHYVSSEPLRVYLAQCVGEHWECDHSLEAFSLDQKTRVSLCLHDNITQQLSVPVETTHSNQRDVSLLALGQLDLSSRPPSPYATFSDLPLRSSSPPPPPPPPPHFLAVSPSSSSLPWILASPLEPPSKRNSYPPVWREREARGGGGGGGCGEMEVCGGRTWKGRVGVEVATTTRREAEQEREERQAGEGQSVSEASESIWGGDSAPLSCCSSPLPPVSPPPPYDAIPSIRKAQHGLRITEDHGEEEEEVEEEEEDVVEQCTSPLRLREFSEENLDFWLAVEKYKKMRTQTKMAAKAHSIFNEFISTSASRQVNVDSSVREVTNQNLRQTPGPASFRRAQEQIYSLMESDSYPRFLKSLLYSQLSNQKPAHAQMDSQNERGSTKSCNRIGPMSLASQSEQKTLI
ncbi:hypothetical protein CRUP_029730 [Coryphaenoides rupestris]|nr:hypothetical protein CRUP_029730 [Coryphaenoides rupestris]